MILTEWNQFRKLDMPRIKNLLKSPKVVDLRNIYDPAMMESLGFEYASVGRGSVVKGGKAGFAAPAAPVSAPGVR